MQQGRQRFSAPTLSNYELTEDGGLLIRNVIAMAPGQWTSMCGRTFTFSDEVLQLYAENWPQNGVWPSHPPKGEMHNTNEKVGVVRDPRYEDGLGVVVDVYLHGKTGISKDLMEQVQLPTDMGGVKDVSVETNQKWDVNGNVTEITFTGLAIVDVGACETCKIPEAYAAGEGGKEMAEGDPSASGGGQDKPETLVSISSEIFKAYGFDDIAALLDVASATEDQKALDEIMAQLREKAKKEKEPDMDIAEIIEPFGKKLDEILTFGKKSDEENASLRKELADVKAEVQAFSKMAVPQTKGAGTAKFSSGKDDEFTISKDSLRNRLEW